MKIMWHNHYTPALVGLVLLVTLWTVNRALYELEKRRLEKVNKRKTFEAVPTVTPLDKPGVIAKDRAADSIRTHYRNTRKLLFPVFVLVGVVSLVFPYLSLVPATALSVTLSAATVVVGIAAKPPVENFIAGLVLGFSRVLNIGDTVTYDGHYATVEDISMTHTVLKIWDWRRLVIPNSKMLNSEFQNFSLTDLFQWAHVEFWVAYEADLETVREISVEAARASEHFADYEEPGFWVMETGKDAIRCWVAAWAETPSDAWYLKSDIRDRLIKRFAENGIRTHGYNVLSQQLAYPSNDGQAQPTHESGSRQS